MNATIIDHDYPYDPAKHYEHLSSEFAKFHRNPVNVAFHFLTTPLGMIGFFSLLRSYTKSSSTSLFITALYLISLLPILPSGEFIGTVFLCFTILQASRLVKLSFWKAVALVVIGYILQDLAHMGTGEKTFQSTYSAGGQVSCQSYFNGVCL